MWNKACHCKGECNCSVAYKNQEKHESVKHASEEKLHREQKGHYQGSHQKKSHKA